MSTKTDISIDEQTQRNGELLIAFTKGIIDGTIIDDVPSNTTLILMPGNDQPLADANVQLGIALLRQGKNVYFRHI